MTMRKLGVYGANLPTKKERSITPANFSIAGLAGKFSRKYDVAFPFSDTNDAALVLGGQTDPSAYGWDALNGFFANLRGNRGTIYVGSYKGAGAVQASKSLNDTNTSPEPTLKFSAAYQGHTEYGVFANRTGYTFIKGAAFTSAVKTLPTGTGATARVITLTSVIGVKVGDVICLVKTGSAVEYHYVTAVDQAANTVTWADADYAGTGTAADYVVNVVAAQVKTYRKDDKGVVAEVDAELGKKWCTFNAADPDKYIESVFAFSSYLKASKLAVTGAPVASKIFPDDVTSVTYLEGGTDGTAPTDLAGWNAVYALFNALPVRMIANPETANSDFQKALEVYCKNREDNPIAILVGQYGLATKAACIAAGQAFQRSDEVDAIFEHNWYGVPDPFASSPTAPKRAVPAVGHLMGWWIAAIAAYGIHASPARKGFPVLGVSEVYGYTADDDQDRTDLAEAGVNVSQVVSGRGVVVRNWFTPSTAPEFRFSNAVIQRNYIKRSIVDSLEDSENSPNDIGHVRSDRMAALQFMNRLWLKGSNGTVAEGETFGQYEKDDGSLSSKDDAFEVIADATNNSVSTLQAGERNMDLWFMFPAPAGSIKVGVGLIYKVQ